MTQIDTIARIEASLQSGGWTMSGAVFNDADRLQWHQSIDAWFSLYTSTGWEAQPRPGFRGHLEPEPWVKTVHSSSAPLKAFTAQEFMRQGKLQGIYFKDVSSPANDHQINGMQLADIVEHILGKTGEYGHCNLVKDVWPEGFLTLDIDATNSTTVAEFQLKEGDFWGRLQEFAEMEAYVLYIDKNRVCHYVPHPMFDDPLPTPVFTLDSSWLLSPLTFRTNNTETVGQVVVQGSTPGGLQIYGRYPTEPTAGPIVTMSGYLADDNSLMATIAEREYKFRNRDITIVAEIGNGVGLMIDLLDRLAVTYSSAADGISWTKKKFWVNAIEIEVMSNFTAKTKLTLDAENA